MQTLDCQAEVMLSEPVLLCDKATPNISFNLISVLKLTCKHCVTIEWDPVKYYKTNYRGSAIAQCVSFNLMTLMNVLYVVSGGGRNGTWTGEFNTVHGIWSGLWRSMEGWVQHCTRYLVEGMTEHGEMSLPLYVVFGRGCDGAWKDESNIVRGIWLKVWRSMERWVYRCTWYLVGAVTKHGKMSPTLYEVSGWRYDGAWRDEFTVVRGIWSGLWRSMERWVQHCTRYLVEGMTEHGEMS